MGNSRVEVIVGVFLVIGFLGFGWLALQLGEVPWLGSGQVDGGILYKLTFG